MNPLKEKLEEKFKDFFYFLKFLFSYSPKQFVWSQTLVVISSLIGGIGLLTLVPILNYSGWLTYSESNANWLSNLGKYMPMHDGRISLGFVLFTYCMMVSAVAITNYFSEMNKTKFMQNFEVYCREQFVVALVNVKWEYLLSCELKNSEYVLNAGLPRVSNLTINTFLFLNNFIQNAVYLVVGVLLSPSLTLVSLTVVLAIALLLKKKSAAKNGKQNLNLSMNRQVIFSNFLDGVKIAKVHDLTDEYLREDHQITFKIKENIIKFIEHQQRVQFGYSIVGVIFFSLIFLVSFSTFHVSIPSLIVLLLVYNQLIRKISNLQILFSNIMNMSPTFRYYINLKNEFIANKEKARVPLETMKGPLPKHILIRAKQVSFSYTERPILENVSFDIYQNQITAFKGRSGIGKSTCLDLLLGLLKPVHGSIVFNQMAFQKNSEQKHSKNFCSYVPQSIFLFNDTVKNNLTWLTGDLDDEAIWRVLSLVDAYHLVKRMPDGLNTMIGDRGVQLSGGERQKLAITRALLATPSLLVLDEATSEIDNHSEALIMRSIADLKTKMTVILIAHRDTTIGYADKVIDFGKFNSKVDNPIIIRELEDSLIDRM
jgi:ATP-binding cassette subfamily C protein